MVVVVLLSGGKCLPGVIIPHQTIRRWIWMFVSEVKFCDCNDKLVLAMVWERINSLVVFW